MSNEEYNEDMYAGLFERVTHPVLLEMRLLYILSVIAGVVSGATNDIDYCQPTGTGKCGKGCKCKTKAAAGTGIIGWIQSFVPVIAAPVVKKAEEEEK